MQTLNNTANDVAIRDDSVNAAAGTASVTITSGIADRRKPGWVWREARPSDRVCVTGAVRRQTRRENELARSRVQPGGGPSGPDTCRQGSVSREAFPGDHVCATRTQARQDNVQVAARLLKP